MHSELLTFCTNHPEYRRFSDGVKTYKEQNPGVTIVQLAADYFENVYPTFGANEDTLYQEICDFIDSLQLVIMHRSYNSSKSDNVQSNP